MPRFKRYCPLALDINDDPETWELTDRFGDRALRVWIEALAILEKTENRWKLTPEGIGAVARKVRVSPKTAERVLTWALTKGWLTVRELLAANPPAAGRASAAGARDGAAPLAGHSAAVVGAPNYWKFHPKQAHERAEISALLPSFLPSGFLEKEIARPAAGPLEEKSAAPARIEAAEQLYRSDKVKYARLFQWIAAARKGGFPEAALAAALERFAPYAKDVRDWWPYLDRLVKKEFARLSEAESARVKAEEREYLKQGRRA